MKIKHINKHVFVWIGTFLLGGFGIDRFMRGQVCLGILKFFTGGGFGLWYLIDLIIGLVKAYGSSFDNEEVFTFINGQYAS